MGKELRMTMRDFTSRSWLPPRALASDRRDHNPDIKAFGKNGNVRTRVPVNRK